MGNRDGAARIGRAGTRAAAAALVGLVALAGCDSDQIFEGGALRPGVAVQASVPPRLDISQAIEIAVSASAREGGAGLTRIGYTLVARGTGATDSIRTGSVSLDAVAEAADTFEVMPFAVESADLPEAVSYEVHGFVIDEAGNCAATRGPAPATLACRPVPGGFLAEEGIPGLVLQTTLEAGTPSQTPGVGDVADLLWDPGRQRLYLSNRTTNSILAFDPAAGAIVDTAFVGSQPWGMALSTNGTELLVANSGGANISFVSLGSFTETRRLQTANAALYTVNEDRDTARTPQRLYTLSWQDFSDRPQYVAQDRHGVIFYSTFPTAAQPQGVIQYLDPTTPERDTGLMIWNDVIQRAGNTHVVTFADSMKILPVDPGVGGAAIQIFDHVPGQPGNVITGTSDTFLGAVTDILSKGSDILAVDSAQWVYNQMTFAQPTFVETSGDGDWVVFGEGGVEPAGRVALYGAQPFAGDVYGTRRISDYVSIDDLVNNASQPLTGMAVNGTGSRIVARSADAIFFFDRSLRLQGSIEADDLAPGGVAMRRSANAAEEWVVVGTTTPGIAVYDPVHYRRIAEISVPSAFQGPVEVSGPVQGDPAGTVFHVYGVTSSGRVVSVAITSADLGL